MKTQFSAALAGLRKYLPACLWALAIAIFFYCVFDFHNLCDMIQSLLALHESPASKLIKILFVSGMALSTYLAVALCLLSNNRSFRLLGLFLLILGAINTLCVYLTGSFISVHHILIALFNYTFIFQFLTLNKTVLTASLFILFFIISLISRIRQSITEKPPIALICLFLFVSISSSIWFTNTIGPRRSTFFFTNTSITLYRALLKSKVPYTPRNKVVLLPKGGESPNLILFIIDESITYETLVSTRSILTRPEDIAQDVKVPAFTYKAHSVGNNSAISNYILRSGLSRDFYPKKTLETLSMPTIFAYAKAAHYKTVFIDVQAEQNQLQNYMSQFDLTDIDIFLTTDVDTKKSLRDIQGLEKLRSLIDSASPENKVFIIFVKYGAHFPYLQSISEQKYAELPGECTSTDVLFSEKSTHCKKLQYEAAVLTSVDTFFQHLFEMIHNTDFAILYTSDHGQNLESKNEMPHGSLENVSECEISVPITVIGKCFSSMVQTDDIKSHFQIAPTIYSILGFEEKNAIDHAISLYGHWQDDATFLTGLWEDNLSWQKPTSQCKE